MLFRSDDGVFYYEGELAPDGSNFRSSNFKEIRSVIIDKKKATDPKDFFIVLKPGPESTYKNTIDLLDEMSINEVKRYAMVDITDVELQLIKATESASGVK